MNSLYNLTLTSVEKEELKKIGFSEIDANKEERSKELTKLVKNSQKLKADEMLKIMAPTDSYDFFVSHSSHDRNEALAIAKLLRDKGYTVFVDSEYWLLFDDLAKELNKNHLHDIEGHSGTFYDHDKTKEIQKHCDVMLTASLAKVLSKTDFVIFLNTPNSTNNISKESLYKEKLSTNSPWIYYEILVCNILLDSKKEVRLEHFGKDVVYQLDENNMKKIDLSFIERMQSKKQFF